MTSKHTIKEIKAVRFDVRKNEDLNFVIEYVRPPATTTSDIFGFVRQCERLSVSQSIKGNDHRIKKINDDFNEYIKNTLLPTAEKVDKMEAEKAKEAQKRGVRIYYSLSHNRKEEKDIDEDYEIDEEEMNAAQIQEDIDLIDHSLKQSYLDNNNNNNNNNNNDDFMISEQTELQCDFMMNAKDFNNRINKMEDKMKVYSIFII